MKRYLTIAALGLLVATQARAQSFQEIQMRQQMDQMQDEARRQADQRWYDDMSRTNQGSSDPSPYSMPPTYGR